MMNGLTIRNIRYALKELSKLVDKAEEEVKAKEERVLTIEEKQIRQEEVNNIVNYLLNQEKPNPVVPQEEIDEFINCLNKKNEENKKEITRGYLLKVVEPDHHVFCSIKKSENFQWSGSWTKEVLPIYSELLFDTEWRADDFLFRNKNFKENKLSIGRLPGSKGKDLTIVLVQVVETEKGEIEKRVIKKLVTIYP